MTTSHSMLERLGVLIESRVVRIALVVLIILSVLPYVEIEAMLRPVLLLAFGGELLVRIPLLIRRRRTDRASTLQLAFLAIDVMAFLSFLPLEEWFHRHFFWLTFLRLSRLLLLVRFARDLAADLYSILTRREQLQQFGLVSVAVGALAFVSAVVLTQLDIGHDYDGLDGRPDGFWDRMWWSFRQIESPDNLVENLSVHPMVGVISLTLTIMGVFIISFVIGIGTNVVEQVVRAERRRNVSYSEHTVVVGPVGKSELLVREFVRIYRKNRLDLRDQLAKMWRWLVQGGRTPHVWRLPRMALLGDAADPPPMLYERDMRWVVYRQGEGSDADALARIGAARAKRAILLGDRSAGEDADAVTVATLAAFRELNRDAHVFVELLSSRHHATLSALTMDGTPTFPLDLPWYLGLFLLHHLVVPGVERLYQWLLTADGSELYTHVFTEPGELEALARQGGPDGCVPFSALAVLAERHRADEPMVLVGVFLGPARAEGDAMASVHELVPWVNPHTDPWDPRAAALGASAGRVPMAHLRGVIVLAENHQPVRGLARALTQGSLPLEALEPEPMPIDVSEPLAAPRRILVVGYGDSVASLALRLAQMTPSSQVTLVCADAAGAVTRLGPVLARSGVSLTEAGAVLERRGRLEVREARGGDAMERAIEVLTQGAVESVVFLAEPDAEDPDARTALRMLRLAEHLLASGDAAPHVLAELVTLQKGERARTTIEQAFARRGRTAPRITLVSTEQIRHYFMVHSAFVPGIHEVYARLLSERGQDILRLPLTAEAPLCMADARVRLAERGILALGLERADGSVELNPHPARTFEDVRAIYAIGAPPDGRAEA